MLNTPSSRRASSTTDSTALGRPPGGILAGFLGGLAPTLLFGFGAQVAVAVINLLAIPVYLHLMGAEAYGLFGFYLVLLSWILQFDFGVGPAVARQLSRFKAGALGAEEAVSLLAAAEIFFLLGGLVAGSACLLSTNWMAHHWLRPSHLPAAEVSLVLGLIGVQSVVRWLSGLYLIALVGLERQIATNTVALIGALVRNVGAVLALMLVSHSPTVFFIVWAVVTLAEAIANRILLARAMPIARWRPGWRLLYREFGFAAGFTVSAAMFTLINEVDKLTLSHTLPLKDFGVFSLVISICAGIYLIVPPVVQAFQPRLTTLVAQARRTEFVEVYRLSIAISIVVGVGLAGTIAARPDLVVYAWTGDREIAARLAPTLTLFAIGAGFKSFRYPSFVLQYSQGVIRPHLIGSLIFGAIWIPAAIWAAVTFGTVGAGMVCLSGNLLYLLLWVPVIHRKLLSSNERSGISLDIWSRLALLACLLAASRLIDAEKFGRATDLLVLATISTAIMAAATLSSRDLRAYFSGMIGYTGVFSR